MTAKWRFIDEVDMTALHGLRCELDVSANWIGLTPLKGGAPIIIAQAVKSRPPKPTVAPNDQPAGAAVPNDDAVWPLTWRLAQMQAEPVDHDPVLIDEQHAREPGAPT